MTLASIGDILYYDDNLLIFGTPSEGIIGIKYRQSIINIAPKYQRDLIAWYSARHAAKIKADMPGVSASSTRIFK